MQAEVQAAFEDASKVKKVGPIVVSLGSEGELSLPAGYIFIPTTQAVRIMNALGNPTEPSGFLGMVFSDNNEDAFITLTYEQTGHIKDDDSDQISNADSILDNVKKGTAAANKIRSQKGYGVLDIQGWAEKPRYDQSNHRLVWAINAKSSGGFDDDPSGNSVVNYNTRVLGRTGLFTINLVTSSETINRDKSFAEEILAATKFQPGQTYADYNPNTDHTANYGLTGLILGGGALVAAKKFGLLALMLVFFKKGWIIILIVLASLAKFLFGNKK